MSKPLLPKRRHEATLDLPVATPQQGESKQSWVYRQIQHRILNGALPSGARLPSTRSLAQRWKVARSTVEAAYDQLRSEGYTSSTVGSGTYIAAVIPDHFFRNGLSPDDMALTSAFNRSTGESDDHQAIESAASSSGEQISSDRFISPRRPDASLFPMDAWRKVLSTSARRASPAQLTDDDPQGWRPLREQIAHYLGTARGIACDPDQVIVLSGIRDGLDLSCQVLLSQNGKALVEDPGYIHAGPIFGQYTSSVVPLEIDGDGFSVTRARQHRGVKLIHVTPAHQSPIGLTMPVSRRLELLAWAEQVGCWIIEDDYDSEFNYDGAPLAALKSLDAADRVIHCGSFNKTMFNALRIGYVVVPRLLVNAFVESRRRTGRSHSIIEQMALSEFIENGSFARHVRRARSIYAKRRDAMMELLSQTVGEAALQVSGEHAGFHLVWWLPTGWNLGALLAVAKKAGLGLQAVSDFCHQASMPDGVVIGHSALSTRAFLQLGEIMQRSRPGHS